MTRICLISVTCLLSVAVNSQKMDRDQFMSYLMKGHVNELVMKIGKNEALRHLLDYTLADTISAKEIWYNEAAIDSALLERNYLRKSTKVVSLKMKAIYWVWLIYSGQPSESSSIAVNDVCSNESLFDYQLTVNGKYKKSTDSRILEIETNFIAWGILFKAKGLKFLQEKSISPLNSRYRFASNTKSNMQGL